MIVTMTEHVFYMLHYLHIKSQTRFTPEAFPFESYKAFRIILITSGACNQNVNTAIRSRKFSLPL